MTNKLAVIDIFSGCGGSALGFSQAGLVVKSAVDIDEQSNETFKANFPKTSVITSDISYVSGRDLLNAAGINNEDRIVLIACPPCQGFSSARRRSERLSDKRNLLIYEFVRMVDEIRPYVFVLENVPGLANGAGKPIFHHVLNKLKEIGYNAIYGVLDSADYGVPQRRKRLIAIGTKDEKLRLSFPVPTNRDPTLPRSYPPPWSTVRSVIGDLPPIKAGVRSNGDYLHVAANLSEINIERLKYTPVDGGDRTSWPNELILKCHRKDIGYKDIYGRMAWDRPSPTITGGCVMISKGRFGHPEQLRAISLREAARLQSFPDGYIFKGSFTQIADQVGNAVPPLLARHIGESLIKSIEESKSLEEFISSDYNAVQV